MMMKTKIGMGVFIPAVLLGGYLFYPPHLPQCDDGAKVTLNLTRLFVDQIERAGAHVIGLNVQNIVDKHDADTDVRFCASTINFHVKQNALETRFSYQTEFHIKWGDKASHAYYIELLKLAPLSTPEYQRQKDLGELTAGFDTVPTPIPHPIPSAALSSTPSSPPVSLTPKDVVNHDIIFFAPTEDNDAFVTLFKEGPHTVFLLGNKDGINYRYVIPTWAATAHAGGGLSFEDDGVKYTLMADNNHGMVLHIHDGSGNYQVVLDTTDAQYINRISPTAHP